MTCTEIDSSLIDLVGYDATAKILDVRFVNSGFTYRYFGVTQKIYKGLIKASSKGRYMLDNIIDCYECVKVKDGKRRG